MLTHKTDLLAGAVHTKSQSCIILALSSDAERLGELNTGSWKLCALDVRL